MSKKTKPTSSSAESNQPADASTTETPAADISADSDSAIDLARPVQPRGPLARYVSFGLLLSVIVLVGFVFFEVMVGFLVPLFLAALLVVVFRPLHRWMMERTGQKKTLSAGLATAAVFLTVLVPMVLLLLLALVEGRDVIRNFNPSQVELGIRKMRTSLRLDMPAANEFRVIDSHLLELQQTQSLDEMVIDQHRSRLYEIEEAAKTLAVTANLTWPADVEKEKVAEEKEDGEMADTATKKESKSPRAGESDIAETENSVGDWDVFCRKLQEARQLNFKSPLTRRTEETEELSKLRMQSVQRYQALIAETAKHFSNFKSQLFGGKTRAWLADLVNPSSEELELYTATSVRYLRDKLFQFGGGAASFLGKTIVGFAIMIIGLYFFLKDGPGMLKTFQGLSPLDDAHEQELVLEFEKVSRAVVVATLLAALAQGVLAGIGFYFVGLESVFLLTVLTTVLAMVPFVGAAAVWVPCCFYLYFVQDQLAAAIGLALYGSLVVSTADNVIKPYVLHGQSNLHPLLALLSVLGGVATLGPIGILVGPMIVAFLQTLLKILQREITVMSQ